MEEPTVVGEADQLLGGSRRQLRIRLGGHGQLGCLDQLGETHPRQPLVHHQP